MAGGLLYAAVAFAAAPTGGIVALLVSVVFNNLMDIIWPEPILMSLLR